MIHIRPHHLVCLMLYKGKGYSAAFTQNMDTLVDQLNQGAPFTLKRGKDDVCNHCPKAHEAHTPHPCKNVGKRDARILNAFNQAMALNLQVGDTLSLTSSFLKTARALFEKEILPQCSPCEWEDLCRTTAAQNFDGCKLHL